MDQTETWDAFMERGIYRGDLGEPVAKQAALMGSPQLEDIHPNPNEQGALAGRGRVSTRWVLCEQEWLKEGLCESAFNIFIDARLEPNAGFGVHGHHDEEELIYCLEGSMDAVLVARDGTRRTVAMGPGDLHIVRLGEQHGAVAGPHGARYLAIANRLPVAETPL